MLHIDLWVGDCLVSSWCQVVIVMYAVSAVWIWDKYALFHPVKQIVELFEDVSIIMEKGSVSNPCPPVGIWGDGKTDSYKEVGFYASLLMTRVLSTSVHMTCLTKWVREEGLIEIWLQMLELCLKRERKRQWDKAMDVFNLFQWTGKGYLLVWETRLLVKIVM